MVLALRLLLASLCGGGAAALSQLPTLVVLDDMSHRATHSQFFELLEQHGHSLVFAMAGSPETELSDLGEWRYSGRPFAYSHSHW